MNSSFFLTPSITKFSFIIASMLFFTNAIIAQIPLHKQEIDRVDTEKDSSEELKNRLLKTKYINNLYTSFHPSEKTLLSIIVEKKIIVKSLVIRLDSLSSDDLICNTALLSCEEMLLTESYDLISKNKNKCSLGFQHLLKSMQFKGLSLLIWSANLPGYATDVIRFCEKELPEQPKLKTLSIDFSLADEVGVAELALERNKLFKRLGQMNTLKRLILKVHKNDSLAGIGFFLNLTDLEIAQASIVEQAKVPNELLLLKKIKKLKLKNFDVSSIIENIDKLSNLQDLSFLYCSFPEFVRGCLPIKLKRLELITKGNIKEFTCALTRLSNLEELQLSNDKTKLLEAAAFSYFKKLKKLHINGGIYTEKELMLIKENIPAICVISIN